MSRIKIISFLCLLSSAITLGRYDILSLKKTASRPDLIELSMAIWSGFLSHFSECCVKCAQEPSCLSLLYNRAFQSCHIFNIIYDSDANGSIDYYWVLDNRSSRWAPKSCLDVRDCSDITTNGEFWIYPTATNGKRTKVFCHTLATEPSHFITLKNMNSFFQHEISNLINTSIACQSSMKPPLKRVEFTKIKIQIEDMEVVGRDYTFTSVTGSPTIGYGESDDCNGPYRLDPCPHFGHAVIDTRGTGLIVDPNTTFGLTFDYKAEMKDFIRSADGSQISFLCAGWCSKCGPTSGPIKLLLSTEFTTDARPVTCRSKQ